MMQKLAHKARLTYQAATNSNVYMATIQWLLRVLLTAATAAAAAAVDAFWQCGSWYNMVLHIPGTAVLYMSAAAPSLCSQPPIIPALSLYVSCCIIAK
jgi:hypothetical protein